METTNKTLITVATIVNAPVEKAWTYWTEPAHIIRWNNASDDWCTLKADNDLREGGSFSATMAAKDGSFSFDFAGVYDKVNKDELIEYTMADGRKVKIVFSADGNETTITETFEAENTHSVEMQQTGWQNIINNFKKHAEANERSGLLRFEISINAPVGKVYKTMLNDKTYREWTAEFNPTSYYKGSWDKGSKILFLGTDKDGKEAGMVSKIRENVPDKFVSIEHLGMLQDGQEITSGPAIDGWAGALENYTFRANSNSSILEIDMDSNEEFKAYFMDTWPKALKKLKDICENN
ncbi:MAG: SRPBCC domain-containing protein [Sphingobacteriales bacterium]|nr:SRPBCC domain-containing protein [Sphingobacteriales bacterium]